MPLLPSRGTRRVACGWIVAAAMAAVPVDLPAQNVDDERAVRAIADSALVSITAGDWIGLTDLYLDEAQSFIARDQDGRPVYSVRTRAQQRATSFEGSIIERGFDPTIQVSGNLAAVWLPYDLYVDGEWSHCGVDAFQMVRTPDGWRIAAFSWTIEQPPACEPHPDGPPS